MSSLDLVIRVGRPSDELRYTIRSLSQNLPHARLFTAGIQADWLTCPHINVPRSTSSYGHAFEVLLAILDNDTLTPEVIVADDDMYLLEPLEKLPAYHRGPLGDIVASGREQGLADTIAAVGADAQCRDLHVPSVVNRARLRAQLDALDLPHGRKARVLWRTLHANGDAEYLDDVKVRRQTEAAKPGPWLSTNGNSWNGKAGQLVRETFPTPSRWER